jgi:hypothetical protein
MNNKKVTQIIIWVIVVSMVLGLIISAITIFT